MLGRLRYTLKNIVFGKYKQISVPVLLLFCTAVVYFNVLPFATIPAADHPWKVQRKGYRLSWHAADVNKRDAIVEAFKHAWHAYERSAMGSDEFSPISKRGTNHSSDGGIGYTIVDALDTMVLMGLDKEYSRARYWIKNHLSFERDGELSTFETTIRVLGGLLSTYALTSDPLFLAKATDLADRLLPAFDIQQLRKGVPDPWSPNHVSTAEAATLQLEFKYLSHLTGDDRYWRKAEHVMDVIHKATLPHHLVPIFMNVETGTFTQSEIRLGSRGDSYYEYLLKQYLQTKNTEPIYRTMYEGAMQGIHDNLIQKSLTKGITYLAEMIPSSDGKYHLQHKQDHLVCFLGGSLMLGAATTGSKDGVPNRHGMLVSVGELTKIGKRDWETGKALVEGCMATHETETGMSPEIVQFRVEGDGHPVERDWYIKASRKGGPSGYDARYMLRPETAESLFLAYRLTGDARYRAYTWSIFTSIQKHARLPGGGYATVLDVDTVPVKLEDKQETFFLSETLKYMYLTFADAEVLSLDDYVFNTEAHPLPVFEPSIP